MVIYSCINTQVWLSFTSCRLNKISLLVFNWLVSWSTKNTVWKRNFSWLLTTLIPFPQSSLIFLFFLVKSPETCLNIAIGGRLIVTLACTGKKNVTWTEPLAIHAGCPINRETNGHPLWVFWLQNGYLPLFITELWLARCNLNAYQKKLLNSECCCSKSMGTFSLVCWICIGTIQAPYRIKWNLFWYMTFQTQGILKHFTKHWIQ